MSDLKVLLITALFFSQPVAANLREGAYDGKTLAEWRQIIKELDPKSAEAAKAIPGLLSIVNDNELPAVPRRQAAMTLGRIGEPAVSAVNSLRECLRQTTIAENQSESPRNWSIKALALFGPVAADATPDLIAIVDDRDALTVDRVGALDALAQIGTANPKSIPVVIRAAAGTSRSGNRDQQKLQTLAVESLGVIGPSASAGLPTLIRLTFAEDENLRRQAVISIGRMRERAEIAMQALTEVLVFDESPAGRDAAAISMANVGPLAIKPLASLLADRDAEVRWRVAHALSTIGPRARPAILALTKCLKDQVPQVRLAATDALWKIEQTAKTIVPTLLNELTSQNRQHRIRAFRQLVSLGADGKLALSGLEGLLKDERSYVRQVAKKAIARLQANE